MNPDLRSLVSSLAKAPAKTKAVAALCALALAAVASIAGVVSNRPHFVPLYSQLDHAERVAVEKALAEGGVSFRTSDFPPPFVVYVDASQTDRAQILVALAEALKPARSGIHAGESGSSTIFMSSGERSQTMLKREWQETEHLLEQLDFVSRATVTTSVPDPSPLRKREPPTVSVALKLRGSGELSSEQAENVAKLVRFRFGVPAENVVISDQSGRTLHDPSRASPDRPDPASLIEHGARYDRELAAKVNSELELAFGKRMARVTVTSEWDHEQRTLLEETLGEPVQVRSEKTTSKTPQGSPAAGGPAGTASNLASGAGDAALAASAAPGAMASTSEERSDFEVPRSRTQTVRSLPRLKRLYVSLLLDESLGAKKDEIQSMVQASVGLDVERKDVFGVTTTSFPAEEGVQPEGEGEGGAAPESEGLSPTVKLLLQRGVEIASALAFVVVLLLSLKGARKAGAAQPGEAEGALPVGPDPELVARVQIEELVRTDPRRVGEILSRWAGDEQVVRAGK
jgi:flagellar biosynthesis/type III secretory pathway M-ring protein FliF/YscJ